MSTYEVEVGVIYWSRLRDFLSKERFKGRRLEYHEGSGWVTRIFTLKGDPDVLYPIVRGIENWIKSIEEADREREMEEQREKLRRAEKRRKFFKMAGLAILLSILAVGGTSFFITVVRIVKELP